MVVGALMLKRWFVQKRVWFVSSFRRSFLDEPLFQHEGGYDHEGRANCKHVCRAIRGTIVEGRVCTLERSVRCLLRVLAAGVVMTESPSSSKE